MKFVDEYRSEAEAQKLLGEIRRRATRSWTLMEICGGQTHTLIRSGIDRMLTDQIELVHGPGCPVCVTPLEMIDRAINIAQRPNVIFTSFGDMLRVPGSSLDLLAVKANGGDVRIVYSPLDAVRLAEKHPDREVVFFAVGFETTAPANAMAVHHAKQLGLTNFSMLVSHVLVPPAMEAILGSSVNRVQGFLAAGHVCAVMGYWEYEPIAKQYNVPIVVTGFEPIDLLHGILMVIEMLEDGRVGVENQYSRAVNRGGNQHAQDLVARVFQPADRKWRGIGGIPRSGLELTLEYREYDAGIRFDVGGVTAEEPAECIAGTILQGLKKPFECPAFGTRCTPERPLGAPMVSTEGACAAYYHYARVPA
jgi:hydrogenase expression/formation protein HypD